MAIVSILLNIKNFTFINWKSTVFSSGFFMQSSHHQSPVNTTILKYSDINKLILLMNIFNIIILDLLLFLYYLKIIRRFDSRETI